uniref:Uncharacterized protein n=1 Tax=Calidris pygmaea TaxID=425635 RepID=A0A8C3KIT1_9CHAR
MLRQPKLPPWACSRSLKIRRKHNGTKIISPLCSLAPCAGTGNRSSVNMNPEFLPESQLPANYCGVSVCPALITDTAPLPVQEYLNPSLLGAFSIHQPHRRPCSRKHMGRCKQKHQRV